MAFGRLSGLHTLSLAGGPTVELIPGGDPGDWAPDGTIYYTPTPEGSGVWGVPAEGDYQPRPLGASTAGFP